MSTEPSKTVAPALRAPSTAPAAPVAAPVAAPAPASAPVDAAPMLSIGVADLAAAIGMAIKGVKTDEAVLAGALTEAINASKPKPKVTVANRTKYNPLNPTNRKRVLRRPFFQNFMAVDVDDLTDEEYDLLVSPELKPGQFLTDPRVGPLLELVDVKRGGQIGLHLRYNNADVNQRMNLESKAPGLAGKLRVCIHEYKTQLAERKRRRDSGEDLED